MENTLNIYDAAKLLNRSPATVKEMIYMKKLKAEKVNGGWRIDRVEVEKLRTQRELSL